MFLKANIFIISFFWKHKNKHTAYKIKKKYKYPLSNCFHKIFKTHKNQ